MVVKHQIEFRLDKLFHKDSYGYRPGKSAKEALGVVRERNWKYDWVIKFDIKGMFDNIDHTLLKKALQQHISERWVLLYIERWLNAPMSEDGVEQVRTRGVPQGGVISPLLSNLFLHYAFDRWMSEHYPEVRIVRYAGRWYNPLQDEIRSRRSDGVDRTEVREIRIEPSSREDQTCLLRKTLQREEDKRGDQF